MQEHGSLMLAPSCKPTRTLYRRDWSKQIVSFKCSRLHFKWDFSCFRISWSFLCIVLNNTFYLFIFVFVGLLCVIANFIYRFCVLNTYLFFRTRLFVLPSSVHVSLQKFLIWDIFNIPSWNFLSEWMEWMTGVLRPFHSSGHIGHTYILNTNAKWK